MRTEDELHKLIKIVDSEYNKQYSSLREFERACNVDHQTIRRFLSGETNPRFYVLCSIAKALDMSMSELFQKAEI